LGDGKFSLIQSDIVQIGAFTSFQVTAFTTLNDGYAIVYSNTTIRNTNSNNSIAAPFSADAGIYAIILHCSVDYVSIGHSCIAAVERNQTSQVPNVISAPPTTTTTTDSFYVRIRFFSSGTVMSLDLIFPKSNNTLPIIKTLPLGGYALITRQYTVQSFSFSFDLYNEYDQQSNYNFPLKPIVGNMYGAFDILNNNKMLVVLNETITSWSFLLTDMPPLSQYNDTGYGNLHVNTTYPQIGVSNLTVNTLRISITYQVPIALNDGNLFIYQNLDGNSILRLKINARTWTQCNVSGNVITIDVLNCTFNDPLGSYYIEVDNYFIKSSEYNEPIMGIYPNVWTFATDDSNNGPRADDIYGSLRLTVNGTKRFQGLSDDAKRNFTYSLIDELTDRIPTEKGRLGTTENYQFDISDSSKVIISVAIYEKKNADDKMTATYIWDNLDQLIRYKNYTNILTGSYTSYLDETYGYHRSINVSDHFNLHKTRFIVLFLVIAIFTLAFFGALSENFIILQLGIALFRFGTFTAFIVLDSKYIPHLFIPRWFSKHGRVAVTIALLSGTNIDVLLMLKSCLAGFKMFNAPFNDRSLKIIFWGACADIFLSDIPQFIIQILFITSSVLLDPIPPFTLASSGIFALFKSFTKKKNIKLNGPDTNDVNETEIVSYNDGQ
ncbi:2556_t:CDS:10, partial [Cetraspora pellucida]